MRHSAMAALAGHQALPADPLAIAAYLAERVDQGAAAATVRTIRAAIRAGHVDTGADDPTGHDGVRRVLQGLTRQAAGRGRGQADPLTADNVAAIMATASIPRRTGRGMESEADAADRGATDRAIVAVLFQGGSRHGWSPTMRRPSQPSRAPSLPTCNGGQGGQPRRRRSITPNPRTGPRSPPPRTASGPGLRSRNPGTPPS